MARILVVDDEPSISRVLQLLLRDAGHVTDCVTTGEAAIEFAQTNPVDVVVLDYRLPGMNGHQVLTTLHRQSPEIGAILITAYGEIPLAVEAMRLGAFNYLTKPFDNNDLLVTLGQVLDLRQSSGSHDCDQIDLLLAELQRALDLRPVSERAKTTLKTRLVRMLSAATVSIPLFATIARSLRRLCTEDEQPFGDALSDLSERVRHVIALERAPQHPWLARRLLGSLARRRQTRHCAKRISQWSLI